MAKPWFRTKRYGYGAGLPCRWEGWAAIVVFVAATIALLALPRSLTAPHPWLTVLLHLGLTGGFIMLVWHKSEKPWTWRWGK